MGTIAKFLFVLQDAHNMGISQSVAGVVGVRQGQGSRLSAQLWTTRLWRAMRANTGRRRDTDVSPILS
jgi:hypothetical protein